MKKIERKENDKFLVEIGVEEMPVGHCKAILAEITNERVIEIAEKNNIILEGINIFVTPLRIVILSKEIEQKSDNQLIRGPLYSVSYTSGKPNIIAEKFAKSHNVKLNKLIKIEKDGKFYVAVSKDIKKDFESDINKFVSDVIKAIPLDKTMNWSKDILNFTRPIRSLIVYVDENKITANIAGVISDIYAESSRFQFGRAIKITSAKSYLSTMQKNSVIVDNYKRRTKIVEALNLLNKKGFVYKNDGSLIDEVNFLTEYPSPVVCEFDKSFLSLPDVVIETVLMKKQRYFPLHDKKTGKLTSKFVVFVNHNKASTLMKLGHEKVIRARLNDAAYFFDKDKVVPIEDFIESTKNIIFHESLGSIWDKVQRMKKLSAIICDDLNIERNQIDEAATLSKFDLASKMVGEFSSLQGQMGKIYAQNAKTNTKIAQIIAEHYYPRFFYDDLPASKEGSVLALVDKIDTLVGFFLAGKSPKGNSDPFALKRMAIGIVRILWEKEIDFDLSKILAESAKLYLSSNATLRKHSPKDISEKVALFIKERLEQLIHEKMVEIWVIKNVELVRSIVYSSSSLKNKKKLLLEMDVLLEQKTMTELTDFIKRIYNIAVRKNILKETKIDASKLNKHEKDFYTFLVKNEKSVPDIRMLLTLKDLGNVFFDNNLVMSKDKSEQERRLSILSKAYKLILKVLDPKYLFEA